MSNLLPLSEVTYEVVSWPASEAAITNPAESIKPIVELVTSKTPYPMHAGLTTMTDVPRFLGVIGWESSAVQKQVARGSPEAFEALKRALAPLMADVDNPQVELLFAHWPADPSEHLNAPFFEFGIAKAKEGTSVVEAQAKVDRVQKAFNIDAAARGIVAEMMIGTLEDRPGEWAFVVGYESQKALQTLAADEKMRAVIADAKSKVDISLTFAELKKYA